MRMMVTLRERLIPTQEIRLVFVASVLPIYLWSIIQMLREVPAWILRLSAWQLIGVIAYVLAFALLETLVFTTILIFVGLILPARFFSDKIVAYSTMIVFLTAIWAVLAHYNDDYIRLWRLKEFIPWLGLYALSIGFGYLLIHRSEWLAESIRTVAERLTVLAFLYVIIGILSVFVVILRNI